MSAAAPKTAQTPNLYELQGAHVHITYGTSSFAGPPQFTYHDSQRALQFTGDEIRTAPSEIGTLVTVSIVKTVDTGYTSFSLLVPHVNLDQGGHAEITTVGITTLHRGGVILRLLHGQMEVFTVTPLIGTARAVIF